MTLHEKMTMPFNAMLSQVLSHRPFPKGIFPRVSSQVSTSQVSTSQVCCSAQPPTPSQPQCSAPYPILATVLGPLSILATVLGPLSHSSRRARSHCKGLTYHLESCRLGNCPFGKLPIGKIPLGRRSWKNEFGKVPNTFKALSDQA